MMLRADPDAAEQALAGIADNTRAALDELRATLGLLRSDADEDDQHVGRAPAPGVGELPALIETFVVGGVDVHVRVDGAPYPLSAAGDLALYRIAQEALTNASKHAPGSVVDLTLTWAVELVTLIVTNVSPGPGATAGGGTGHGLIGMRERAAAADGELSAGPTIDGGYRVQVQLPRPIAASEHPAVTA